MPPSKVLKCQQKGQKTVSAPDFTPAFEVLAIGDFLAFLLGTGVLPNSCLAVQSEQTAKAAE
jgi:hypothetical protein